MASGHPLLRARDELVRGLGRMLGTTIETRASVPATRTLLIGTLTDLRRVTPALRLDGTLAEDAFRITSVTSGSVAHLVIAGGSDRGVLYGAFALLRRVSAGTPLVPGDWTETPYAPLRWINHWDNIDGSIECGYGGRSIFWDGGHVRDDLSRVDNYGRLLASLGINGISVNNVNANRVFLSPELTPQVARLADVLRPWGVRLALSVDFSSPSTLGGLPTFDPLDAGVAAHARGQRDRSARLRRSHADESQRRSAVPEQRVHDAAHAHCTGTIDAPRVGHLRQLLRRRLLTR